MSPFATLCQQIETIQAKGRMALANPPLSDRVQAAIGAGLVKSTPVLCGPLRVATGEVALELTDDGRKLLPTRDTPA
ncbi:hypothetical protein IMW82_13575 [Rhodanobacter sp. B2A1Ga4]|uniref:hypothetical protein n=1 Tax=Rhodanobacter sp. B2A1Ga4 TaxID=2778647 RepID=UPI001B39C245|nr:hypothetical protein [Rhodanobacter sp. B2A1Ga4]MBQ4855702.1 hypothetical protein [Rhodanobacter sp. B2A1Ga4]